jgi:hypothetical protein
MLLRFLAFFVDLGLTGGEVVVYPQTLADEAVRAGKLARFMFSCHPLSESDRGPVGSEFVLSVEKPVSGVTIAR